MIITWVLLRAGVLQYLYGMFTVIGAAELANYVPRPIALLQAFSCMHVVSYSEWMPTENPLFSYVARYAKSSLIKVVQDSWYVTNHT